MPDHSQFNNDRTYPGLWTVTFSNPRINMFVPTTIVELGALMTDLEADPSVKVVVFQSANPDLFIARLDQGGYLGMHTNPMRDSSQKCYRLVNRRHGTRRISASFLNNRSVNIFPSRNIRSRRYHSCGL